VHDANDAGADAGGDPADDDHLDESTVVVDRGGVDERTVVMRRTALEPDDDDERTVVADRSGVDERTIVVDRSLPRGPGEKTASAVQTAATASDSDPSLADTITAPPARQRGLPASPAIYKPRPAPLVPSRPPSVAGGEAPTRDVSAVTASVARRGARGGVLALVSVALACVVSVAGLVAVAFLLLG